MRVHMHDYTHRELVQRNGEVLAARQPCIRQNHRRTARCLAHRRARFLVGWEAPGTHGRLDDGGNGGHEEGIGLEVIRTPRHRLPH